MAKGVELKAMKLVMEYEKTKGRKPNDVSKDKNRPFDIKSGRRCIEVKGQGSKSPRWVWLYKNTLKKLGNDVLNYYIYVVYDVKRKPKLRIIPPGKIFGNLQIDPRFLLPAQVIKDKRIEEIRL
jgi:hypothetical protein